MPEIIEKVEKLAKEKIARRGIVQEFREFINRGNVVDLSVAFVMGAAFKTVV
ncbi:MAG: Large-conductance mechanosensitive channel, MscL, partial [Actinomycetota bacterium]